MAWACLHCFHRHPVCAGCQGQPLKEPDQAAVAMHWAPRQVLRSQGPCQVRCSQGISIFKNVELHLKVTQHASSAEGDERGGVDPRPQQEHKIQSLQACQGLLVRRGFCKFNIQSAGPSSPAWQWVLRDPSTDMVSSCSDLVRAEVIQSSGHDSRGWVPRQQRRHMRHEPAAEGGATGLQQALHILQAPPACAAQGRLLAAAATLALLPHRALLSVP